MTREEQIEVATATYINGRLKNNVPPEEIEEIRLAYQAGAIYADEHPKQITLSAADRGIIDEIIFALNSLGEEKMISYHKEIEFLNKIRKL